MAMVFTLAPPALPQNPFLLLPSLLHSHALSHPHGVFFSQIISSCITSLSWFFREASAGEAIIWRKIRGKKRGFPCLPLARSQVSPSKDTQRYFPSKYYRALSVEVYWLKRAPTLLISELLSLRIVQINASYIAPFSHASPSKLLLPSLPCQGSVIPASAQPLAAGSSSLCLPCAEHCAPAAAFAGCEKYHSEAASERPHCLFLPIPLSLFALPMENGKLNYSKMSS